MKMKGAVWAMFAAGAAFAAYIWHGTQSGDYSMSGFSQYARSLASSAGAVMTATTSDDPIVIATGLVAGFEHFSAKPYPDPKGQTTTYSIGYGHQIVDGDGLSLSSVITNTEGVALLAQDIQKYSDCVDGCVTISLTPQQKAALISLCYNIGCAGFTGSTLVADLNSGVTDAATISTDFAMWKKSGGLISEVLISRRNSEAALFTSSAAPVSAPAPAVVDASTTASETNTVTVADLTGGSTDPSDGSGDDGSEYDAVTG